MTIQWQKATLAEVAILHDSLHKTPKYSEVGFPMVRVTDIQGGYLDTSMCKVVDEDTLQEFSKKHAPAPGDILFTRVGSYGNSALVVKKERFCLGQNTVCISPDCERIEPTFLFYFLNSPDAKVQIESFVGGASQPTISLGNIKRFELPLPPLTSQQRIASILSAYDDLIENNTRRIEILEEMARRLYEEWFVHFRFPGHEDATFIDTEDGRVPEGWRKTSLEAFGKIVTGKTPSKKRPEFYGENVPFLKLPDMHGKIFSLETSERLSTTGANSQSTKFIPTNSLCVSCIGTAGIVVIASEKLQTNQQINSLIPNEIYLREYLFFALNELRQTMNLYGATGATMTNLSRGKFAALLAKLPEKSVLCKFHHATAPFFDQILTLQKKNRNLRAQRDLLLPKLISGEIDVSKAEEVVGGEAA